MLSGSLFAQKDGPTAARLVRICLYLDLATVAMLEHLYPEQEPLIRDFTVSYTEGEQGIPIFEREYPAYALLIH